MKKIALAVTLAMSSLAAYAGNTTAALTADNQFALYTGNAAGTNLTLVGEGDDWQSLYTFDFNTSAGDYLYVVAKDWGGPQAWQGAFNTPTGALYSQAASWKFIVAQSDDDSTGAVQALIANGGWAQSQAQAPNDMAPWGSIVNDGNATWMWHDNLGLANDWNQSSSSDGTYAIFRTNNVVAVPEPETYGMMLAGLGLLGVAARRRKA
ncbi:MAG: FxDxF family PEP-CTERM protein [Pseudomonadota bacterium]